VHNTELFESSGNIINFNFARLLIQKAKASPEQPIENPTQVLLPAVRIIRISCMLLMYFFLLASRSPFILAFSPFWLGEVGNTGFV
jgi:hypothetical protein